MSIKAKVMTRRPFKETLHQQKKNTSRARRKAETQDQGIPLEHQILVFAGQQTARCCRTTTSRRRNRTPDGRCRN